MNGLKFISFCFFDANTAENGRGNDVFFNESYITQSPFTECISTTPTNRVWNAGTATNDVFNNWLPLIPSSKIVGNSGTDAGGCGRTQQMPCATIEFALNGFIPLQIAHLTLLNSTFVPTQTLTFNAADTKITGNGTDATTIASSGIPQQPNSHSHSSQSTTSLSSFSSLSTTSSPDPSSSSALFQQTQGSLTVSALTIAHNSTNQITPILFHLSDNSPSLNLNTTTITGTTPSSSTITTPLFFLTAGSLALNHTAITSLPLSSPSIFHLTSLTAPLTLNSSNITHITSTATPTSCVLSSATSPALSLSLTNCTITNINSEQLSQQTATNGGCISFASSASDNTFSASDSTFSSCSVSEDTSSGGRGGALMIEFNHGSQVSESSFSITNIVFSANKACVGRDMYFVCESLVASVKEPLFSFMRNITQKDNSVFGSDRTQMFSDWDVDLFLFLDGFIGDKVYVDGASGVEEMFCGLEKVPCKSVNYGMERLKRMQSIQQEIIACSNSLMAGCLDVGGMSVKAKTEAVVEIECQAEVSGSEGCVLKSSSLTEMEFIGIVVPSSFNRTIASVIESSSTNGELHMKNCEMSVIGGKRSTIGFSLIKSTGKKVELDSVTISDVKSTVSLFSFSLSSANMNEQEFKLKLLNCTLKGLEIDSGEAAEGKAAVFGGSFGVGMVLNDSKIEGAVSEKSKEGGALKIVLSEGGYVALENSSFTECICENMSEGGKGGGIYLDCSLNEEGFQLSSISFSGCSATVGKNMFVKSESLVNTVKIERFAFDCSGYKDDGNAFVGEDGIYGEMDLRVFLVSLKWVVVSVSTDGHDTLGCGSEVFPCQSMKSGIDHIDRSGTEGERKVKVRDEGTIEDIYSFIDALVIDGCVNEGDEIKHRPIHFEGTIKGNSGSSSVISSTSSLILLSLKLQIPSQFISKMNKLISSSGVLQLENCSFENQSSDIIQYSLICATSGSCTLKGCSMTNCLLSNSPFVMSSSVLFERSNFSNIMNTGSGEGGVARVILKNDEYLIIKSTNVSSCSLSTDKEKGGFLYFDCQECSNEKPFLLESVTFENNNAAIGKKVFIMGKDFNASVTNNTFKFDYLSMINDDNLFVGSDGNHQEKDLFMFLIPYSSFEIFISSEGFDVARCGSEEEPCLTMWKGMKNMKKENEKKTIQIEGSTIIRDSFNVSNYQIKKSVKMGEENAKAILNFEKSIGSQLEYFMENDDHLELTNIQLQLSSGFDNSAKTIISNKGGDLAIRKCSFHSEAGVDNGFDCVFVDAIGGSVKVNDLSIESCNVGNSIFVINNAGITCHFVNVRVESLNESRGCIISIKKCEPDLKTNEENEECINIEINKSSFSGVKRSDNGPSILESKSEKNICLVVSESNITEDKAETSEKGGAIFFTLGASGSMKMIDSTINHCSCSSDIGRGGGVYLATKERGDLNFSFLRMKFRNNTASVGNDIFIECFNITSQINENQFQFDLRDIHFIRDDAIFGRDLCDYPSDTNLIEFVMIHQSDTIIVCGVNGSNEKQCGTNTLPCYSIDYGLMHLTSDFMSQMIVVEESVIGGEINLNEMSMCSKSREMCEVEVKSEIESTREALVTTAGSVSFLRLSFVFDSNFISSHESMISPEGGILEVMNCSFISKQSSGEGNIELTNILFRIINMEKGELQLMECKVTKLVLHKSALHLSSPLPSVIYLLSICNSTIETSLIDINECGQLTIKDFKTENVSLKGNEESLMCCMSMKKTIQLVNCTMGNATSKMTKGKLMKLENCSDVKMDGCIFDGSSKEINEENMNEEKDICKWDGSLVEVVKSSVMMKDTTISNSLDGGVTLSGGNMTIEMGLFENNNPSIEGYPSLRRNIICSDSGILNVMSLKGGDGVLPNTSLWMLNDRCSFEGIVSERDSSFFIPVLESVEAREETDRMKLIFKGLLLVPCNLSFSVVKRKGEEKEIEKHDFDSNGFLSENEAKGSVGKDLISNCGDEIEVSVSVLFGNAESPSSTNSFIMKNTSEAEMNGDERIVEGGNGTKFSWIIIVVSCIIFVVLLLIIVVVTIRWRNSKRRTEELEEIVNDTVKKDPKLIEMVTMEMSPEEQWRRAEREAEKKNEENAKRRMCGKKMAHSESEEYLLSESGSTEYILGKDSDKIPDWMLEKVDEKEEEETRKRTPSPSISSISSTSTTDSDSTFVRGEDLCPTTSSMSNLVDAMACSCPYEKLIVDLRDSLFMLLHGRNEKKEMAIGSLKEREQTASQILFWVANLALHSFDEMDNPLQSLANLSPHIVLFSEHMVICVVMHSDFLSSDDSDSSSASSITIVSTSSNISVLSERFTDSPPPSSAFEDDEDRFKKECLRWKAPELQMNRKMGATKESVVFSIGMMLWECLTLDVPFGEYEAEVAGQKIVNGERPRMEAVECVSWSELVKSCWGGQPSERKTLGEVKRELIGHFPAGAVMVTMSDAIDLRKENESGSRSGRSDDGYRS